MRFACPGVSAPRLHATKPFIEGSKELHNRNCTATVSVSLKFVWFSPRRKKRTTQANRYALKPQIIYPTPGRGRSTTLFTELSAQSQHSQKHTQPGSLRSEDGHIRYAKGSSPRCRRCLLNRCPGIASFTRGKPRHAWLCSESSAIPDQMGVGLMYDG